MIDGRARSTDKLWGGDRRHTMRSEATSYLAARPLERNDAA